MTTRLRPIYADFALTMITNCSHKADHWLNFIQINLDLSAIARQSVPYVAAAHGYKGVLALQDLHTFYYTSLN